MNTSGPVFVLLTTLPYFDVTSIHNLEILVSKTDAELIGFIQTHFGDHFVALDVEYQDCLSCCHYVDGFEVPMTTVDVVTLQFATNSKVLIVPIFENCTFVFSSYPLLESFVAKQDVLNQ